MARRERQGDAVVGPACGGRGPLARCTLWIVRKAANFEAYCAKSNCRATCQNFPKEFWTRSISTLVSARVINRLRIPPSLRGTDSFRDFLRVILPPGGFVFYIFVHFRKVIVEFEMEVYDVLYMLPQEFLLDLPLREGSFSQQVLDTVRGTGLRWHPFLKFATRCSSQREIKDCCCVVPIF